MRSRHESAFLEAFDAHADALFRHASFRLSDRERARDLTQDTFIKAWDYLANEGEVRHWKSFLYRILNNLIIDEYRRTKESSLDELIEGDSAGGGALLIDDGLPDLEDALDNARAIEGVRKLIQELPQPYQTVLIMRYVDGLSIGEIAQAQGVSENVVSVRIHRATLRLRELCKSNHIL